MQILRWDPFGMVREVDRLLEGETARREGRSWIPRIDVYNDEAMLKIRAEIPGVASDDIDITVEDGALTLSGTRSFETVDQGDGYYRKELVEGVFKRTVFLPDSADVDAIEAKADAGILEVTIPTKPEALPKKVSVQVS